MQSKNRARPMATRLISERGIGKGKLCVSLDKGDSHSQHLMTQLWFLQVGLNNQEYRYSLMDKMLIYHRDISRKLSGGVRPASQNPYPIYDQSLRFSLPY